MASGIYERFKANLMNKEVDLEGDTIKVILLDDSHSFTATDNVKGDIVANEVTGTEYVAGGATLSGKGVTQAAATKWDATDVTWAATTITAAHAVIYDSSVTDNLICSIDFSGNKSSASGDFTIQWNSSGIITLT